MPHDDSTSSSSSSSSSSNGSSSSADPDAPAGPPLNDAGSEGTSTHRKLPKPKKLQTPDERVTEDLSVAKFYEGRGNLQAAYLRTKDAVNTLPDDPESHFALAEVAQKLKKNDEAIAEFKTYLKLEPDGDKVKAAQKALAQLQ
jgi:tetratricopeptide (TPR) repeat protein